MIRQATKYDKTQIIEMMKMFRQEADLPEYKDVENLEYWNQLLDSIFVGQGIVFIDEIDKVCRRGETSGADVSREGVQRDLLPLIEGCTVNTKYGMIKTDHILFIFPSSKLVIT